MLLLLDSMLLLKIQILDFLYSFLIKIHHNVINIQEVKESITQFQNLILSIKMSSQFIELIDIIEVNIIKILHILYSGVLE